METCESVRRVGDVRAIRVVVLDRDADIAAMETVNRDLGAVALTIGSITITTSITITI